MASGVRKAGRLPGWLAGVVLAAACAVQPAWGQEPGPGPSGSRLRAADPKAAALLATGAARSATFKAIVDMIERSDLITYVETRPLTRPGQLQFLVASPVCRHVRVSVRVPGLVTDQIAWLAHELWHAVEIAGAPDVSDQASLQRFYGRIGDGGRYSGSVESGKAQQTWTKVLDELRTAR